MSTPEIMLARLETEMAYVKKDLEDQKGQIKEMDDKLQQLLDAANMGRGAWWVVLKIGGFIILLSTAAAWVYERGKSLFAMRI